ncbi:MAG: phosphopantothenoylcysteine decarboxylase, partial [Sphingobacteriales bacterium]|nr:phosphopantothenoylcysteine decarboxylase [Sphingobacteriales bacterium]
VLAAAVADYTPAEYHSEKIKKGDDSFILKLRKTKDILATLGKMKQNWQILVGFSLETENEIENSRKKLIEKNCDMIVLNSLKDKGAGFGTDTNQITILERNGTIIPFTLKSKKEVAFDILARIETML